MTTSCVIEIKFEHPFKINNILYFNMAQYIMLNKSFFVFFFLVWRCLKKTW